MPLPVTDITFCVAAGLAPACLPNCVCACVSVYLAAAAAAADTIEAINAARLSATRCLMLGAGDVLVMDNYR
jgi:hypothetical protein